jgi:ADP-ribosylglycohydrolase
MSETLGTQPDQSRPKSLRDRYRGTLLGLAVGNALGLPVESWSKAEIRRRYPGGIREIDPAELDLPWDDDLAQAVIIAEAILEHDTLDRGDLAARLTEWASSNGRGMGSQTRAVINALRHGMAPSEAARVVWEREGGSAAGNGAVMRCAPVAMRWRTDEVRLRQESERSAEVTHHDPRCGWSAYAVNLAIAGALGGRRTSIDSVARALVDAEVGPHTIRAVRRAATPSIDGLELDGSSIGFTLKAMQVGLWCLENGDDFEKTLLTVVHAGGDTDTNGAVAGAVLGAIHGVEAIPDRWVRGIPRAERLLSIADRLLERSEALTG